MDLKRKLILEGFDDDDPVESEVKLTPEEEVNFHVGTVSDLLNKDLELYNLINTLMSDPALRPDIHQALESVADDLAISIGKLQECLKMSSDEHDESLMNKGEEEVKNISNDISNENLVKEE